MTRFPSLMLSLFALCAGCTRDVLAVFVPKLELRCNVTRDAAVTSTLERSNERFHVSVSAWLRWQPAILARDVLVPLELTPSAWIAPCALDDATCLSEVAEVEREVADELRRAP
jgi:hypothetical protein